MLRATSWKYDDFYVKVWALHRCNLNMTIAINKAKYALQYLEVEVQRDCINSYFHLILCREIESHCKSLRFSKGRQVEMVKDIILFVEKLSDLYKNTKIPKAVSEAMADLIFELVKTMSALDQLDYSPLSSSFDLLIEKLSQEKLLNLLISLQILIENDKSDSMAQKFTSKIWGKVKDSMQSDDIDLSQASRDILTYFLISRQQIPFEFSLKDVYTNPKALE